MPALKWVGKDEIDNHTLRGSFRKCWSANAAMVKMSNTPKRKVIYKKYH